MTLRYRSIAIGLLTFTCLTPIFADDGRIELPPRADERQLPNRMHSQMSELPSIRVGIEEGDLVGRDNRVLQAAVDYIGALGGGTVEIGPGEFQMFDSLHLRSQVTVIGAPGRTVLKKAASQVTALALDGDFGEQQFTVADGTGFEVGRGVAIWDDQGAGFHTTVARITGRNGSTFSIDKPMMADYLLTRNAHVGTLFPVVSGYDLEGAAVRNLIVEGNRDANQHLNGCRGGGIFLYRGFGTKIENCTVRNYNGDGISFQQSNDVQVVGCVVENNAQLGLHPGSGSQRPVVRNCTARGNGTDGLFLCWRVRHGLFEDNLLEGNGRFGISIGHKDTDNLLQKNMVRLNRSHGVFFRNESLGMAAHRNRLIDNTIEDNGDSPGTAAIRVRGVTTDLVFEGNRIRDTRPEERQTQTVGVLIEEGVGAVTLSGNAIDASKKLDDRRSPEASSSSPR